VLATFDDEDVVREGQARFKSFLGNPASLPSSLANVVTQIAGRHADQASYDALLQLAQKALSTEEKQRYYTAMANAKDPVLAKQTMTMALSPDLSQVVASRLVQAVAANDHRQLAWTFARDNSEALLKPLDSLGRNNYFPGVIDGTASTALADEMEAFVKQTLDADAFTVAKRIGDIVRVRAEFKSRLLAPLAAYLGKGQ
jgi:aminopeptidase N